MRPGRLVALGAVLVGVAASGSGCGTVGGDCSGGTGDGAGNCIPYDHGPRPAVKAALAHYANHADDVVCFNRGPFRYHGQPYHAYGCEAIRDGHLQNDELYCVYLRSGVALTRSQAAMLPARKQVCD